MLKTEREKKNEKDKEANTDYIISLAALVLRFADLDVRFVNRFAVSRKR